MRGFVSEVTGKSESQLLSRPSLIGMRVDRTQTSPRDACGPPCAYQREDRRPRACSNCTSPGHFTNTWNEVVTVVGYRKRAHHSRAITARQARLHLENAHVAEVFSSRSIGVEVTSSRPTTPGQVEKSKSEQHNYFDHYNFLHCQLESPICRQASLTSIYLSQSQQRAC